MQMLHNAAAQGIKRVIWLQKLIIVPIPRLTANEYHILALVSYTRYLFVCFYIQVSAILKKFIERK